MPVRNMTDGEKNRFKRWFSSLDVGIQPRVTGEVDPVYNCIAWTIGATDRWINPKRSLHAWDNFYALHGYERADDGEIAVWKTREAFTHGCVAHAAHGFDWESKCGGSLRILHQKYELVGQTAYGNIIAYYAPMPVGVASAAAKITAKPLLMTEQQRTLGVKNAAQKIDPAVRAIFDPQYEAWKATWFEGEVALSSDTLDRADSYSYSILLEMGPDIIPLVVEKLNDPGNYMATQLYDDLQPEPTMQLKLEDNDPAHLEGEQGRAKRIIELFLTKTQT